MFSLYAHIAFALILTAGLSAPANADIYKYVDSEGVIHFSNMPQDKDSKRIVKEGSAARPPREGQAKDAERPKDEPVVYGKDMDPLDEDVPYSEIINDKCDKYGVEPTLVRAIIQAESNFNPNAVSPKGAKGLMQLMPATAADMGVSDLFDPEQNIDGGVRYFRYLLDNFGGDVELSVAAYNCGEGRVYRNGMCVPEIKETKNYVKKVLKLSNNPLTGESFSRAIYKVEMKDGSIIFTDSPVSSDGNTSLVE